MANTFFQKENAAKEIGCKYYIHLNHEDILIVLTKEKEIKLFMGEDNGEYIVTPDNHLICVTANSISSLQKEATLGKDAIGFVGTIQDMWYSDAAEKII